MDKLIGDIRALHDELRKMDKEAEEAERRRFQESADMIWERLLAGAGND